MAEIDLKYDPEQRRLYVREEIAKVLGLRDRIRAFVGTELVLLLRDNGNGEPDYERVLRSLEAVRIDLELCRDRQKQAAATGA